MPKAWANNLKSVFSWREPGTLVSALGHGLVLAVGLFSFTAAKPFSPAQEALAVDVVSDQQFSEMMRGDKESKVVAKTPERRVERVAETKEDKDPGQEKRDVPAPPSRSEPQAEAKPEPEPEPKPEPPPPPQQLAAVIPPTRPPELRLAPPVPSPPARAAEEDKEDEKAELLRRMKLEEQRKLEEARAAVEAKRRLDEKLKAEAEAQKRAEDQKKAEELKKAEDQKKAEDLRKAEELKKTEERRKAEAEKKAREDKARREAAEEQKLNDAIRNRLLASRETPSSTGSTGATVSPRATAGTSQATGAKLSPSDRMQLIGILTSQMNRCINYSGSAPKTGPQITFTLGRDGSIAGQVQLANRSGEPNFVPFAEASMRALRNCQPYRIPARFLDTYEDWKNVRLNIDTSEMQ